VTCRECGEARNTAETAMSSAVDAALRGVPAAAVSRTRAAAASPTPLPKQGESMKPGQTE
jgi:hypothetical protein